MSNSSSLRHAIATSLIGVILQSGSLHATAAFQVNPAIVRVAPMESELIAGKNKGEKRRNSSSSSSPSPRPSQNQRPQRNDNDGNGNRGNSRYGSSGREGGGGSGRDGSPNRNGSTTRGQQQPKAWKGFNRQGNGGRDSAGRDARGRDSRGRNYNGKDKTVVKNSKIVNINKKVSKRAVYRGGWGRGRAWVVARPWDYGWYGGWGPGVVVYPGWQWWGGLAPAWGVVSLSPTIVIQTAVDEAVNNDIEVVPVANTEFRIYHASINPISDKTIEFNFEYESETYFAKADCESGLLNDETPAGAEEAELMHSACTIAFNSFA